MLCGIDYNHGRTYYEKIFFVFVVTAMLIASVSAFASCSDVLELKEYTLSYKALTELENGASLDELILIKEEYSLVTPSDDENGIKAEPIEYAIKTLEGKNVRITDLVSLYLPEYSGRFVLITTDSKPYVIPFIRYSDSFGLTNGRLYTLSNANEIIYRTLTHNGNPSQFVEISFREYGSVCRRFEGFCDRAELLQVIYDLGQNSAQYLNDETFSPYKEYSFTHLYFEKLTEINEASGVSISQILSNDKYNWVFPSRYGYTTAALKDGKWQIADSYYPVVPPNSAKIADGVVCADQIDKAAWTQLIKEDSDKITDIVCADITDYYGKYVYIAAEKSAYLIQFSASPELTGLENGKLYELSEANKILHKNFGFEDRFIEQDDPATGDSAEMLLGISSTAAIAMILTAKKRKKSR